MLLSLLSIVFIPLLSAEEQPGQKLYEDISASIEDSTEEAITGLLADIKVLIGLNPILAAEAIYEMKQNPVFHTGEVSLFLSEQMCGTQNVSLQYSILLAIDDSIKKWVVPDNIDYIIKVTLELNEFLEQDSISSTIQRKTRDVLYNIRDHLDTVRSE